MRRRVLVACVFAPGLSVAGCGTGSTKLATAMPESGDCVLVPRPAVAADTITISLSDNVLLEHAPIPHNLGERFLYRHLFGTLITLDCNGRPLPDLARSWRSGNRGQRWELTLSDDAQFWDGTRLTADHVVNSWRENTDVQRLGVLPESVSVKGDRVVSVGFRRSYQAVPPVLADPAAAVFRHTRERPGIQGAGVRAFDVSVSSEMISVSPAGHDRSQPTLHFRTVVQLQQRDMIDRGIDLLLTDDTQVLEYAATRVDYVSVPLPWNRTYVVAAPGPVTQYVTHDSAAVDEPSIGHLGVDARQALARDAVRSEARAAEPPFWWEDLSHCQVSAENGFSYPSRSGRAGRPTGETDRSLRVVYQRGDPVGRDLAERLVALSSAGASEDVLAVLRIRPSQAESIVSGDKRLLARELTRDGFVASLQAGSDQAYVFHLPSRPLSECVWADDFIAMTDWLVPSEVSAVSLSRIRFGRSLTPLVDTRSHLVVRGNRIGLSFGWDGTAILHYP